MILFRIICDVLALLVLGTYIFLIIRNHRESIKMFNALSKKINHLYVLVDILNGGCYSSAHRALFSKYMDIGPFNMPKSKKEEFEIMRKMSFESYNENRQQMVEIINSTDDPIEKRRQEQRLKDTDSIFNLMGTIDEKSSESYIKSVLADINASIYKIMRASDDPL
jgi:hypothetical protein